MVSAKFSICMAMVVRQAIVGCRDLFNSGGVVFLVWNENGDGGFWGTMDSALPSLYRQLY